MSNPAFDQRTDAPPLQPVVVDLPWPVSVNRLYKNSGRGKGRHCTPVYNSWKNEAGLLLNAARPYRIDGKYVVTFWLERKGDKRRRDLSNFWKGVSDLLVQHGVVRDDSLEEELHCHWSDDIKGCRVEIKPFRAMPEKTRNINEEWRVYIWQLYYIDNLKINEIATGTGWSESAVFNAIEAIRNKRIEAQLAATKAEVRAA